MVKIFTVMYILCSVCASNPDISSPAFSQDIISIAENMNVSPQETDAAPSKPELPVVTDYMEELKNLGFYKEDSKDAALNKRNAIIRFQSTCNMPVSGTWNDKCLAALVKILSEGEIKYYDGVTAPPSEDKWFTLNKDRKILTLYEGGNVLMKYPVAVGKTSTETPSGKFTIVNKVVNPAWGGGGYAKPVQGGSAKNPLGYRWMGLSYKDGNQVGIHGNNSPYSIGQDISHGCIRMINSDVEELFKITPMKSPVWIGTEKELKDWGIVQQEFLEN